MSTKIGRISVKALALVSALLILAQTQSADASTAYGTINNFDCVNDTGVEAHGFEIELDDIHCTDITYTYDYNHYGIPKITEDSPNQAHPTVHIRYAATRNTDGTWTAYTAIPTNTISPTDGHQFTNPSVNFGGEHFGAGYYGAPTAVRYFWLIDDGAGNLVHGPPVMVATPTFTYYPPVPAQPLPQVQAVIVPPPPPAPPVFRFGDATWVKDIKTTTHNTNKVELVDLVDPDPENPLAKNWANGEPAVVETEWRILQTEFANAGNPKGVLAGVPQELPEGNEIITRRYEFYKYVGPIDAESGEAMADMVGAPDADGVHYFGSGTVTYNDHIDPDTGEWVTTTVDLSTVWVVGEFIGAQMSGFDVAQALGLIDHIADGELRVPYADRTVVVAGGAPFTASVTSGSLPDGTTLDPLTGIFSGKPTKAGVFTFTVEASDTSGAFVSKTYTVTIPADVAVQSTITTSASPAAGGTTAGDGTFDNGTSVSVIATHNPGYAFVNWTEGGVEVSASAAYPFTVNTNRTLVANFVPTYTVATSASPNAGGNTSGGGTFNSGDSVTVVATANAGYSFVNWTESGVEVSAAASYTFTASANRSLVANFAHITYTISTSASPVAGGNASGGGTFNSGDSVTVIATANAGYNFVNWTESGVEVSATASYTFTANASRSLVANFAHITYTIATSAAPAAGGSTSGGGTFNSGDSVTVIATANAGYNFVNWTESGVEVSAASSYTFTASANRSLVANFAHITYTISTSASPSAGGSTSGGGTVNSGDSVSVVATANAGYSFVNWTESGVEVSAASSYTFTASANRNLVANFARITYTIVTGASPSAGGSTSGGGTFNSGDSVTLIATANASYNFVNWTEGGTVVSSSASYTFTASANRSLVANFALKTPVLEISSATAARSGASVNVTVTIRNSGGAVAQAVTIVSKKDAVIDGKTTSARVPVVLGNIVSGGTATTILPFSVKAGTRTLQLKLTYTGGVANLTKSVSIP